MLKFRTTFDYIWLRFVTERACGIAVASRHIPQLTRSNSSAMMKPYWRLNWHAVQCVLCRLFPWVLLWTGTTRLRQLPSTSHPYWPIFNFEHQVLVTFAWLPFHTKSGVIFHRQMVVQNMPLLERKSFPMDSRHLCLRLVVSRRFEVFGARDNVALIKIPPANMVPANSISIGSRSTNGVSRCLDVGFEQTDRQTDRLFIFIRPSSQSREHSIDIEHAVTL